MSLFASDVREMRALGAAIALSLADVEQPFVIALEGELGAGKTTLVGGLLNALGFAGHVRSPTYTLIEPYEFTDRFVYHLDLYRLTDPREVEELGLRELLQPGSVFLVEWPERGDGYLPPADIQIDVKYARAEGREVAFIGRSNVGRSVVQATLAAAKP